MESPVQNCKIKVQGKRIRHFIVRRDMSVVSWFSRLPVDDSRWSCTLCLPNIMKEQKLEFSFEVYDNIDELSEDDRQLLSKARNETNKAYAPYSNFCVGAAAKL